MFGAATQKLIAKETADFILFNTCCVREHAELRTSGNVGFVKELKTKESAFDSRCLRLHDAAEAGREKIV